MPSLFALFDQFYPKLTEWEDRKECAVFQIGAGVALAELPALLDSVNPPEFVKIAIEQNRLEDQKRMLERARDGVLTMKSPEIQWPRDQIPLYFRSQAEAELLQEQPDYFDLEKAWSLIVHEISSRFTKEWNDPYGTFDDELRSYCHARMHGDLEQPDGFSIEIAKLNDKGVGDEVYGKLELKFPAVASGLSVPLKDRISLLELLPMLYAYDVRLRREFDAEVRKGVNRLALDKAITSGDPIKLIRNLMGLPDSLQATYGKQHKLALRDARMNPFKWRNGKIVPVMSRDGKQWLRWPINPLLRCDYDERVLLAESDLVEPMRDLFRKRHGQAGKPVERSGAWNFAVTFIAEHVTDVKDLKSWLTKYCAARHFQSALPQDRPAWLEEAIGGFRGSVIRGLTVSEENKFRGRDYTILRPKFLELQDSLINQPDYVKLASKLRDLDEQGKGVELHREVWRIHAAEAAAIPLSQSPLISSNLPIVGAKSYSTLFTKQEKIMNESGGANIRPQRARLFDLLVNLRIDRINLETIWDETIRKRAEAIAISSKAELTGAQQTFLAEVDSGRLLPIGQRSPDGKWIRGLREIDMKAYQFLLHRGNADSPACRDLAEQELKSENDPAWKRVSKSHWEVAIKKLWLDRGCLWVGRHAMFADVRAFDDALDEASRVVWALGAANANAFALGFVREQDESGYTVEILEELSMHVPSDSIGFEAERAFGATAEAPAEKQPTSTQQEGHRFDATLSLPDAPFQFQVVGANWELRFGNERGIFPYWKGFQILSRLLRFPNEAIQALDLQGRDLRANLAKETIQEVLDSKAKSQYRRRLADIESEIDDAQKNADEATLFRLTSERENIIAEMKKCLGLGDKARKLGPPPATESARVAVRRNLERVYDALRTANPPMMHLAAHLDRSILVEGQAYAYRPEALLAWEFGPNPAL